MSVKTRFAPSPTGLLPFGNVRTAPLNALFAKNAGGVFLLRVEEQLFQPLRAALTGQVQGPELSYLFPLIGFERTRRRLSEHVLSIEID